MKGVKTMDFSKLVKEQINNLEERKAKDILGDLILSYLHPSYGSISKRDFDILLFMKMQELGIIKKKPELYDLVSKLKVTRTKARNLLYEANVRTATEELLDSELKELMKHPIFMKDNDKIALEIDNPLLSDHLRARLKKLGHITDGSFSAEIIKLTLDGYSALFLEMIGEKYSDEVVNALVNCGIEKDKSPKAVVKSFITKLAQTFVGEAGSTLTEGAS